MFEIFDKLRLDRGLSMYKVAKDTGIAQSTLSEWKTGKTNPKIDKIEVLANYFGVTVDYLLGNEEKEKAPEPKTEQERLDEKVLELLHQHSLDAQSAIIDLLARMAVKPEEK